MPIAEHDGAALAYREVGRGAPGAPVLLAHCSLAHSGLWKPILEALAPERHAIAPDMPAHGGTPAPAPGASLQMLALGQCIALAEGMGAPVHLVGLSLGGAVLGRLALARPDLVRSVTLIEPIWFHLLRMDGRLKAAAEEAAAASAVEAAARAGDARGAVEAFMDRWGVPGGFARLAPEAQAAMAAIYPELARDFEWVSGTPPGQVTPAIIAGMVPPAMLMHGANTQGPAIEVLDVIAAALPGARRRVIAGAGHLSPVSHWEDVLNELRGFWAQVEAAG
jgi:pimeloyl-ACP methyl ester carboxylesterase